MAGVERAAARRALSVVGLILVAIGSGTAVLLLPEPLAVISLVVIGLLVMWFSSTRLLTVLGLVLALAPVMTLVLVFLDGLSQIDN